MSLVVTCPFSLMNVGKPSSLRPWKSNENNERTGYPSMVNPVPVTISITRTLESNSVTVFFVFEKMKSVFHLKSFVTIFFVESDSSIPCERILATLAYFVTRPPTPVVVMAPMRS